MSSRAQVTFTVADGANTNPYIPIYGYYTDDYQRTQVIYPASMLTQIEGLSIRSLTFYLETIPSNNWTATFEVKIGVTNANNFTSTAYLNNPSTTVYTGTLIASNDHTLTVNFTTPYLYTDGNLLLDVSVITKGNYSSASFYGINSSNASCYGYHYDGLSNINNISLQNFIPKTTFVTNDTCTTTSVSVSNIMSSSALVSWVPNPSGAEHYYQLSYKPEGSSSWTTCPGNITDNYILLTNLTPLTSYQVRLRTFCGGSYTDLTTSFTTECLIGETATDNITIGSGTETSNGEVLPTSTYYNYSYTQQLFTAAELGSDLIIRQIDVQYFYSSSYTRNIDIYMGHTSKSAFASSTDWVPANELTLVYSGEVSFNNAGENHWFSIPLTNPFQYNGTDNLVVVFDDNTGTYANSSAKFYTHSSTANSSIGVRSDGTNYNPINPGSGSRYSRRMNMRIPTYCDPNGCEAGNVVAMDVTATSARLLFTQGMSTSSYEIQYCEEGGTYSTLTANASPFLLTGLKQNTKYHVRLRSHCASGWSDWTSCQFTTKTKDCTRLYVKTNGTGDGVSWSEAARDLNWALRTADIIKSVTGIAPEIWVAGGVYYGDTLAVNGAFLMKEGINVYGGFAGNETSLSQRDIAAHPTILDGQNVRRVVYQESEFETVTVWDGFTVRNGHASNYGGGAYLRHNATFRNSQFTGNTASYDGGGVYAYASSTRPVHFENCQFIGNATSDNGGGLYGYYATSSHCVFTHNVASDNGGGIYVYGASSSVSTISNCLVANNTAYRGGGIYSNTGSAGVENSTIVNNAATNMGGDIYSSGLRIITNSILWGNRCNGGVNNIEVSSNPVNCVFSAVEAGYPGTGNIPLLSESELGGSLHPKFVHPAATVGHTDSTANTDWHLLQGSVCVNRGNNSYVTITPTTDLDGENRVRHNTVDLGCYESDYDATAIPQPGNIVYATPTGAGNRDGSSWSNATDNIQTAQALASLSYADVWVSEGVYYGDTAATDAFTMLGGVDVYGGFAGNEPANYNLGNRNFSAHPTVLDGMGARRVLYQPSNFQTRTVWDGFTIQNGNHPGSDRGGGGVCLFGSSTLQNCTVTHNHSSHHGGGIYAYGTNAQDSIRIINCIVTNNTSSSSGGGIYAYSKVSILNSNISYDSAYSDAGGVYLYYSRMSNCVVSHNKARPYSSYSEGGGLYLYYGHVSNSLIANNTSGASAGICASYSSNINNCTVVNNENTYSANGAGITFTSSSSHAHNCIVWGNRSFGSEDNLGDDNASSLSYSAVEGGASGEGNIPLFAENNGNSVFYPYFVNPSATVGADDATEDADWRLQNGSPCVNHGSNTFATGYDLDGGARVRQGTVDMGCYESNFNSITLPQYGDIIYVTEQGSGDQSGRDWANAIPSVQNALNLAHTYGADVWVAAGTYHGDGVSQDAFTLKEGVSVYGGFAGNEPADYNLSLRDFNANATILDGQSLQRVLYQPKYFTDSTAVIVDGFTIQNGRTSGYGAGVYMMQYSTLSNCIVQHNNVYYYSSTGSNVSSYGAGVFSYITLSDGMRPNIISDCIIRYNSFEDHTSLTGRGAGLCIKGTKIIRTEISHNTSPRTYGGGIYSYADDTLSNCLVHSNNARYGAGMYIIGANNCFTNCDFVCNTVPSNGNGGGFYNNSSVSPVFTNCILWGNKKDNNVSDFVYSSGNPPTLTYCAVTGGFSGTGNLNLAIANDGDNDTLLYVRLVDPANEDFQLQPTSACIDAGNSEAADSDHDLYGNPRLNGTVDIGCYEANSNITVSIEATACDSYTWNGITYTVSGNYVQTFPAANGSDSVVTLHLTVNYSTHNVETESACESFVWHGQTYSETGTYTYAYTNAGGCESVDTLKLTVSPVFSTPVQAEICDGDSYIFFDTTLTTAGTYTHTLQSISGCDSVIALTLTVNPVFNTPLTAEICEGGNYSFFDTTLTTAGTYTHTLQTVHGCDSVITLTLTVNPVYNTPLTTEICEGSSYSFFGQTLTTAGTYTHTLQTIHGCDSVIALTLTVNPTFNTPVTAEICEGETYSFFGQTLATAGTYTHTLESVHGCDSVITLTLTVNPVFNTPLTAAICEGGSYSFFDTTLTTTGIYTHTLQSVHGCDSVITLTLTVHQPVFGVDERAACDSLTWINGVTYYESTNAPTFALQAANGCDSIVTLHLTIANILYTDVYESGCDQFTWEGTTYSTSGEYTKTFTTASGCDSVVTLYLTIHPTYQISETASICEGSSYLFFDTTLTTEGTYTHALQTVNGCDSVITLTLTVNPIYSTPITATICDGGSYDFFGQTLTSEGTYTHTLQTAKGCDSVIALTLTVNPVYNTPVTAQICEGGSYNFFGQSLTTEGTYTHTLQSVIGCDSVITLTLTVNPVYITSTTATICEGDSYNFFGQTLTTAGTYTHTLQSASGCDSVIALTLTVNSIYNTPVTAAICDGGSYDFFGQTLTTAGTYTHTLQSASGCDSVIVLTLTVNPVYNTPVSAEVCNGGSYDFFGQSLTTAGTYTHTLQSVNGCDSVIVLTLTEVSAYNTPVVATICDGSSYDFFGQTLTSAGTYTHTLQSAAGCDSVITLTLTVSQGTHNVETETACESFTWHGTTYTTSGTYTYAYTNGDGCASVDTLLLTVNHGTHNVETETACESFSWHGETYTTSGVYTYAYNNGDGCESIDTLHLTVNYSATSDFSITTEDPCYEWNNVSYCETGDYIQTLQTVDGCDSVVTLHLTITVGIDDHDLSGIEVFPNPTNLILNIKGEEMRHIDIFNADGQLIYTKENDGADLLQVDVTGFAAGQYFVKVLLGDGRTTTRKVVVSRR